MRQAIRPARVLAVCTVTISAGAFMVGAPAAVSAATVHAYYVAPGGSDSAAGTQAAPWASFAHAQSVAQAGDTVYFRGGTYSYTHADTSCSSQTASVAPRRTSESITAKELSWVSCR